LVKILYWNVATSTDIDPRLASETVGRPLQDHLLLIALYPGQHAAVQIETLNLQHV